MPGFIVYRKRYVPLATNTRRPQTHCSKTEEKHTQRSHTQASSLFFFPPLQIVPDSRGWLQLQETAIAMHFALLAKEKSSRLESLLNKNGEWSRQRISERIVSLRNHPEWYFLLFFKKYFLFLPSRFSHPTTQMSAMVSLNWPVGTLPALSSLVRVVHALLPPSIFIRQRQRRC